MVLGVPMFSTSVCLFVCLFVCLWLCASPLIMCTMDTSCICTCSSSNHTPCRATGTTWLYVPITSLHRLLPQSTKRVFTLCQNDSIEDALFFLICCAASCHCEGPGEEAIQKILGAVLGCIILWTGQSYASVPTLGEFSLAVFSQNVCCCTVILSR